MKDYQYKIATGARECKEHPAELKNINCNEMAQSRSGGEEAAQTKGQQLQNCHFRLAPPPPQGINPAGNKSGCCLNTFPFAPTRFHPRHGLKIFLISFYKIGWLGQ